MKFFNTPIHVRMNAEAIASAKIFAQQVVDTVDYRDSHQSDRTKVMDDHFISKLGELAVYKVFKSYTSDVSEPDYQIYIGDQKSWNADLKVGEIDLAVKTQRRSVAEKYGLSWTFQHDPQGRMDPILQTPDAWVCFVECDDTHPVLKCIVFPPRQMQELVLGQPRLAQLRGKKVVVYAQENGFC